MESEPLFTGRQWLLQELKHIVEGTSPGALILGSPGTGKTTLILQLVDYSHFGRMKDSVSQVKSEIFDTLDNKNNNRIGIESTNEKVIENCFF